MTKKKVTQSKTRDYVDPRLAKATVILRKMLNSFRQPLNRPLKLQG